VALLIALAPVQAARPAQPYRPGLLSTFIGARAAALNGDVRRAATLYGALAAAQPGNRLATDRAIGNALAGGEFAFALRLARASPLSTLGSDARLLLAADALRSNDFARADAALVGGGGADLAFLQPLVRAWTMASRGDPNAAKAFDAVPEGSALSSYVDEQRAFLLLQMKQPALAQPFIAKALATAGERGSGLRLAFADAMLAIGDPAGASALLAGNDTALSLARAKVARGEPLGTRVDSPAAALAHVLTRIAMDLRQGNEQSFPVALVQVARFAAPQRAETAIVAAMLHFAAKRPDDGLAALRQVPDQSPLAGVAHDAEVRALIDSDRLSEALARARAFAATAAPSADDHARVGDVLAALKRDGEAAESFARAAALVDAGGPGSPAWTLHLLHGGALERAGRWTEAEPVLERALELAPGNAVVLNYLGYARLERGEDLDGAEAMLARASALRPNDPSITDSLGWAQFRQGRYDQAIATLGRAAAADPNQAEIHEHLGDALFAAGRRFEARFAWEAARIVADDDTVAARLRSKLDTGLPVPTGTAR
jgi:tetratricopeptide (TPR) repeat protein